MSRVIEVDQSVFEGRRAQYYIFVDGRMITNMGIGRHIAEHLRGLYRLGAAVAVCYLDAKGRQRIVDACPTAELIQSKAGIYGFRERFGHSLGLGKLSDRPDLFWFPQYNVPLILPYPSVVTVHDLIQFRYNRLSYGSRTKVRAAEWVLHNALKQAARIVCVSESTKQDLIEIDGSWRKRIRVVENGVGSRWALPSVRGAKDVKRIVGDKPYLLSVSTKKPHKNHYLLLEVMDAIAQTHEHHLVLAGPKTPEWERKYDTWLSKSSARDRVHDLDEVSEETLVDLYRKASLFLCPSLYEGFGLPVLEAMVAGCPTIVSNRGALPEVVGNASILIDPFNLLEWVQAVRRVLDRPMLASQLIQRGKVRASEFSWSSKTEKLLDVFEEVI